MVLLSENGTLNIQNFLKIQKVDIGTALSRPTLIGSSHVPLVGLPDSRYSLMYTGEGSTSPPSLWQEFKPSEANGSHSWDQIRQHMCFAHSLAQRMRHQPTWLKSLPSIWRMSSSWLPWLMFHVCQPQEMCIQSVLHSFLPGPFSHGGCLPSTILCMRG